MYNIIFILLSLFATSTCGNELVNINQSQRAIATQADQALQGIEPEKSREVSSGVIVRETSLNAADLSSLYFKPSSIIKHAVRVQMSALTDDLQKESDDANTVMHDC